ncbi:MAG: tRNA (adenosine(37)-N6)-threonylcarbamoyltransferase complex dimerization subunit type 1 TsaB [Boseongicola sp. SB0673_bin_14]|nr:tRNA (adenosine(37)-N6)-threonylcarbamoyltransferase complex dimerization subunit type 1 TsaB [Boseongicola sp. SB0673_bin_14]
MSRPEPTILAFDTSAAHCAAALLKEGRIAASRYEEMARGQAESLFPVLEELMGEADADWRDLDAIGVGVGPGNFTGIRISVSAARGLALSLGIPAVGISTFEAIFDIAGRPSGRIAVFLPAPKGSAYFQIFADGRPQGPAFLEPDGLPRDPRWAEAVKAVVGPGTDGRCHQVAIELARTGKGLEPEELVVDGLSEQAEAITTIAAGRIGSRNERPKPLYVRPVNAAPARGSPPAALP